MKTVTEHIFPQYYSKLLGHMPPEDYLSPPNILPRYWMTLKERVLLPYLRERIRSPSPEDTRPLNHRINDWIRINHGL
jgi:hypothetical protein